MNITRWLRWKYNVWNRTSSIFRHFIFVLFGKIQMFSVFITQLSLWPFFRIFFFFLLLIPSIVGLNEWKQKIKTLFLKYNLYTTNIIVFLLYVFIPCCGSFFTCFPVQQCGVRKNVFLPILVCVSLPKCLLYRFLQREVFSVFLVVNLENLCQHAMHFVEIFSFFFFKFLWNSR